jgi:hypothetical protein
MRDHPPVAARKWTTQGGHYRPAAELKKTQVVAMRESFRPLGIVDTRPPDASPQHVSAEMRHLRLKRDRGLRGLMRRLMGGRA